MQKTTILTIVLALFAWATAACAQPTAPVADVAIATAPATVETVAAAPTTADVPPTVAVPVPTVAVVTPVPTEPTSAETVAVGATDEPTTVPPTATLLPAPTLTRAEQLIGRFSTPVATNGEPLILFGQVLDVNGVPIPDAAVEIWQTDASGVYDHPNDPTTANRDLTFQFYGTSMTDADGWYVFRTILPGEYEPRPRHIHFKVKQQGVTVLTSQFYFENSAETVTLQQAFESVSDSTTLRLMTIGDIQLVNGRIVIDTGIGSGTLSPTRSDQEGPYYPVVTVAAFDNDLTSLE